jgi:hypothetical protein
MAMKWRNLSLATLFLFSFYALCAQTGKTCCDNASCKQQTIEYVQRITGIVTFLGNCSDDKEVNEATLASFSTSKPELYRDLILMVKEIHKNFLSDSPKYTDAGCFSDALPATGALNVMRWINHIRFHILKVKPVFPSTEFCGGWKKRFEINQGATAFLNKSKMAYFGSARAYLVYTFREKNKCGGTFRLMAGPGFFLQSRNSYITLSSRLAVRLTDLKASVFSLGNLNVFGGYNSNFQEFSYAEAGLEVELGPFGINLSGNYNTDNKKFGFLAGLVFGNKKL